MVKRRWLGEKNIFTNNLWFNSAWMGVGEIQEKTENRESKEYAERWSICIRFPLLSSFEFETQALLQGEPTSVLTN